MLVDFDSGFGLYLVLFLIPFLVLKGSVLCPNDETPTTLKLKVNIPIRVLV